MVNTQKMYTKGTVIINRKTGICIQGNQTRQNIHMQTYINSLLSETTTPLHIPQQRSPKRHKMLDRQLHSFQSKTFHISENFSLTPNDIKLFTDASSVGFGPYMTTLGFKKNGLSHFYTTPSIILTAIWASCITWSSNWERKRIVFITDNKPITELWQSGSSSSEQLMDLIRKIYSIAVQYHFSISFKHILGHYNPVADALS